MSKEFKVGLMTLVAGVILYLGFNFLKGTNFFSPVKSYYLVYDNIDGLETSNNVIINGFTVGRVNDIVLLQDRSNKILVEIQVSRKIVLGDSTIAMLSSEGLLGGKQIELYLGKNSKDYDSGDTLRAKVETGLTQLIQDKATPVINNLDSTISKINNIVDKEADDNIAQILRNLEESTRLLKKLIEVNGRNIEGITRNLNVVSEDLIQTEKAIKPVINKLEYFADSLNNLELKKTVNTLNTTMASINGIADKVNKGEGTLGELVTSKKTLDNVNKLIKDIDVVINDFKYNPNHYLSPLGKRPKKNKKSKDAVEVDSTQTK